MIWNKFINGMVTLQIKYHFPSFPQPRPQVSVTALPNGAGHLSQLRRTEGMSCMGRCYVQFQQKAALRQTDMFWSKGLNLNAPISCQTVFSTLVQDCTDTSAEGASEKWNIRKRNHNRTWLGEIIALHP